jgi:NTP pyrophosphatase (non-canonical NTP hydrolase)
MPDISIEQYIRDIAETDMFASSSFDPVLKGLFGEVGSLITVSKKVDREGIVFEASQRAFQEEMGDIFWYITALCRRKKYRLEQLIHDAIPSDSTVSKLIPPRNLAVVIGREYSFKEIESDEFYLFELGRNVAALLEPEIDDENFRKQFVLFLTTYFKIVQSSNLSLHSIITSNADKARGRFIKPEISTLPTFDDGFEPEESLPHEFRIEIRERANGKSYMKWKGVFIGDPLTDNISDNDGYRFHDVFHFAHAAILHWSPVFRALIKHKRKSDPETDENQDSGRAIVIEEGISAYIFSHAKQMNFWEGQDKVSFDLLKTISSFVRGYEVQECPLYMWEKAILDGYAVFRELRKSKGGIIVGNLKERSIQFEPLT